VLIVFDCETAIMPLGFEVLCEDFEVSFYNSGTPKEYRSRLHIVEDGKTVTGNPPGVCRFYSDSRKWI
jgi:hypothetical protein